MSSLSATAPMASVQLAKLTFMLATMISSGVLANQRADKLSEQVRQLSSMMEKRPVIKFNADKFQTFVGKQSVPRDYSFILMMTALSPHRDCHICRQASEEFSVLAESFMNSPYYQAKKLFFGSIDYDESPDVFMELGITSAPSFLYFDTKGNHRKTDQLEIQRFGFEADILSKWVEDRTGMKITIIQPSSIIMPIILAVFGLIAVAILYLSGIDFMFDRKVWAFSAVAMIFLMTSGQMWNQIRGTPLVQQSQSQIIIFHSQNNAQYVIESYLVMLMNAGITIGMALVTDALRNDGAKRKVFTLRVGLFLLMVSVNLLLFTFKLKSPSYPYKLFF